MTKVKNLAYIPFEEAVTGELYLTKMKHGWIEGCWHAEDKVCHGYYWHDMEWGEPLCLMIVEEESND